MLCKDGDKEMENKQKTENNCLISPWKVLLYFEEVA